MSKKNKKLEEEPAFPFGLQEGLTHNCYVDSGISKRFYAACEFSKIFALEYFKDNSIMTHENNTLQGIIKLGYEFADELLKQENNK